MVALSFLRRAVSGFAILSLSLPSLVHGSAIPETSEAGVTSIFERQSSKYTPVIGCSGNSPRRAVDDFRYNHADTFNMILLSMQALQALPETNTLSWYGIAGIHGYPFRSWQENAQFKPANPGRGYCTHRSVIFTTWHRPYLILLEQQLCAQARTIAARFPAAQRARWQAAANTVRLPFWDWASRNTQSRIPTIVKQSTVTVTSPTGRRSIANPLFRYRFTRPPPAGSGLTATTTRGPNDNDLFSTFEGRRQATLDLFSTSTYNPFSRNLEGIHDEIHTSIGGNMVSVARSAFDPIFFLHHTNVDRLIAMYQATHPGVRLAAGPRSPTYALAAPGTDNLDTRLYPFRRPNLGGWRSTDVATAESIFKYGYSYPDVPRGLSSAALRTFTTRRVRELYGPAAAATANSRIFQDNSRSGVPDNPNARLEWVANVQVPSNGLTNSYRINVFIGSGQADSDLAGVAAIFADSNLPIRTPNDLVNASVPLTPKLLALSTPLNPAAVVAALKSRLSWSIERSNQDGTAFDKVPIASLRGFVVSVVAYETDYPADAALLPSKGEPVTYYEPTLGKEGGLQPREEPKVGDAVGQANATSSRVRKRWEEHMLW